MIVTDVNIFYSGVVNLRFGNLQSALCNSFKLFGTNISWARWKKEVSSLIITVETRFFSIIIIIYTACIIKWFKVTKN